LLRICGFALSIWTQSTLAAAYVQYLLIAATLIVAGRMILNVVIVEPPAGLTEAIVRWGERFARRLAPA
jgi:lipopolysaccharide export system permease protein